MTLYLNPEIRSELMFWVFMFLVNVLNPYLFRCFLLKLLDSFNVKCSEKTKRDSIWFTISATMFINLHLYTLSILWQYLQ